MFSMQLTLSNIIITRYTAINDDDDDDDDYCDRNDTFITRECGLVMRSVTSVCLCVCLSVRFVLRLKALT